MQAAVGQPQPMDRINWYAEQSQRVLLLRLTRPGQCNALILRGVVGVLAIGRGDDDHRNSPGAQRGNQRTGTKRFIVGMRCQYQRRLFGRLPFGQHTQRSLPRGIINKGNDHGRL